MAVAAGRYLEALELTSDHAGVHLAGRCRSLDTLDTSAGDGQTPGIDISSQYGEVEVSGVNVEGSGYAGIMARSGVIRLAELRVEESDYVGVAAGRGSAIAPTNLVVEDSELVGNQMAGILAANPGTEITLVDTAIRDTQPSFDGEGGFGIEVQDGAALWAEGCDLVANTAAGVGAKDPSTEICPTWDQPTCDLRFALTLYTPSEGLVISTAGEADTSTGAEVAPDDLWPLFEPDDKSAYSNAGYVLLGLIIEAETGVSYGEALRTNLLDPLGLEDTYLEGCKELPKDVVRGYDPDGNDVTDSIDCSRVWAAGNVVATPADLAAWGRALYGGELLSEATLEEMRSDHHGGWPMKFGQGVIITKQPPPLDELIGHTGGLPMGASTILVYHEETGSLGAGMLNAIGVDAWTMTTQRLEAAVKRGQGDWKRERERLEGPLSQEPTPCRPSRQPCPSSSSPP